MCIPIEKNVKFCHVATKSGSSPTSERRAIMLITLNPLRGTVLPAPHSISETHWVVHLSEGTEILHSGRDDDIHREGVAIMMTEEAARSLMDWTPVNERIIKARFHSKYIKLSLIHMYAPTENTSEQAKDEFYTV